VNSEIFLARLIHPKWRNFANTFTPHVWTSTEFAGDSDALSRQQFEMQQRKIDFFIALHRAVGKAGIGLPAKSRAPALVAGWAPRISQKPCIGARLFLLENQRRPLSVFRRLAIIK
jgi:hypothetical protein